MKEEFSFKNFVISQRHSAMKVGTDGVLLGAWARGGNNILDIGAGTGLVSLMMAQRFPKAKVTGVEIDSDAAKEASENADASPYRERVEIIESALQSFMPENKFDAIVSNPPFFTNGFTTPDASRRLARQTDTLTFADILSFAKSWIADEGELSVVLPIEREEDFLSEATLRGFFLSRKYSVKTVPRKKAKRCLLAFSLSRPSVFDSKEVTLNEADGSRSEWYGKLTEDFYLF